MAPWQRWLEVWSQWDSGTTNQLISLPLPAKTVNVSSSPSPSPSASFFIIADSVTLHEVFPCSLSSGTAKLLTCWLGSYKLAEVEAARPSEGLGPELV